MDTIQNGIQIGARRRPGDDCEQQTCQWSGLYGRRSADRDLRRVAVSQRLKAPTSPSGLDDVQRRGERGASPNLAGGFPVLDVHERSTQRKPRHHAR